MTVRLPVGVLLIAVVLALVACTTAAEKDRRNEELMDSLPVPEAATLVQKRITSTAEFRRLHYMYATDALADAVWSFYGDELAAQGWEVERPHDEVHGSWVGDDGIVLIDVFPGALPDRIDPTPIASPPPGTATYFEVTVTARTD